MNDRTGCVGGNPSEETESMATVDDSVCVGRPGAHPNDPAALRAIRAQVKCLHRRRWATRPYRPRPARLPPGPGPAGRSHSQTAPGRRPPWSGSFGRRQSKNEDDHDKTLPDYLSSIPCRFDGFPGRKTSPVCSPSAIASFWRMEIITGGHGIGHPPVWQHCKTR